MTMMLIASLIHSSLIKGGVWGEGSGSGEWYGSGIWDGWGSEVMHNCKNIDEYKNNELHPFLCSFELKKAALFIRFFCSSQNRFIGPLPQHLHAQRGSRRLSSLAMCSSRMAASSSYRTFPASSLRDQGHLTVAKGPLCACGSRHVRCEQLSCVALPFWEVVIAKIVDRVYSKKKAPRNVLAEVHRRDFLEPLRSFFWSATLVLCWRRRRKISSCFLRRAFRACPSQWARCWTAPRRSSRCLVSVVLKRSDKDLSSQCGTFLFFISAHINFNVTTRLNPIYADLQSKTTFTFSVAFRRKKIRITFSGIILIKKHGKTDIQSRTHKLQKVRNFKFFHMSLLLILLTLRFLSHYLLLHQNRS